MINKIAAIVVLFHPPEEVFCNISTYSRIIKDIIIIDNSGKKADKNLAYDDWVGSIFCEFTRPIHVSEDEAREIMHRCAMNIQYLLPEYK